MRSSQWCLTIAAMESVHMKMADYVVGAVVMLGGAWRVFITLCCQPFLQVNRVAVGLISACLNFMSIRACVPHEVQIAECESTLLSVLILGILRSPGMSPHRHRRERLIEAHLAESV